MSEGLNVLDKAVDWIWMALAGFVAWVFRRSIDHGERLGKVEESAKGTKNLLERIEEQNSRILDAILGQRQK